MPTPPVTPHLQPNASLISNVVSSVQACLNSTVVIPYNTAVAATPYNKTCQILMEYPDDLLLITAVPAIVIEDPVDIGNVWSTGNADQLVWNKTQIMMCVYPGLYIDPNTQVQKASIQSAYILRSLFTSLSTQLTMGLTDYSGMAPVLVDYAYIDTKIIDIKGRPKLLALLKRRFDVQLTLTYPIATQNGY